MSSEPDGGRPDILMLGLTFLDQATLPHPPQEGPHYSIVKELKRDGVNPITYQYAYNTDNQTGGFFIAQNHPTDDQVSLVYFPFVRGSQVRPHGTKRTKSGTFIDQFPVYFSPELDSVSYIEATFTESPMFLSWSQVGLLVEIMKEPDKHFELFARWMELIHNPKPELIPELIRSCNAVIELHTQDVPPDDGIRRVELITSKDRNPLKVKYVWDDEFQTGDFSFQGTIGKGIITVTLTFNPDQVMITMKGPNNQIRVVPLSKLGEETDIPITLAGLIIPFKEAMESPQLQVNVSYMRQVLKTAARFLAKK